MYRNIPIILSARGLLHSSSNMPPATPPCQLPDMKARSGTNGRFASGDAGCSHTTIDGRRVCPSPRRGNSHKQIATGPATPGWKFEVGRGFFVNRTSPEAGTQTPLSSKSSGRVCCWIRGFCCDPCLVRVLMYSIVIDRLTNARNYLIIVPGVRPRPALGGAQTLLLAAIGRHPPVLIDPRSEDQPARRTQSL
jgi:hypothetical protein